jgi:predicted GIY-YIG superfamily endonuclease
MNKHPHLNNQDTPVYMWESPSRKRYVGVTNNIERRLQENGSAKADVSAITRAAKGKVKTAYGFTWKFLKEE